MASGLEDCQTTQHLAWFFVEDAFCSDSCMPFRRAFHLHEDWGARCKASLNFDRYLITHYFRP